MGLQDNVVLVVVASIVASALEETANRMGSQDFVWVTQAIAINREVGGNLAEVLDAVGHTIRERNHIRRRVAALAAEGKLSAYVPSWHCRSTSACSCSSPTRPT